MQITLLEQRKETEVRTMTPARIGITGLILILIGWHFHVQFFILIGLIAGCGSLLWSYQNEDTGEEEEL